MLGPGSQDFRSPHCTSYNNRLGIWGESYAGHWGIGLAAYVQDQNDKITTGKLSDAVPIHLDTLGITNGRMDFDILATSYPDTAYHNTYDVQAISEEAYLLQETTPPHAWK
jgi:carboxypeptidase C (cathepsin A)